MPGGGSGPASQGFPDAGRAVAAMPPLTGSATATVPGSVGAAAPAPYAPTPYAPAPHAPTPYAPASPRTVPPMPPGVMPPGPAESHAPIGVPPSAFADTAIVNLPLIDADGARPDGRDQSGGRQVRYANQVHTRTSRGMIIAVLALVVVLIGAVPAFLLLAESSGNPDFTAINKLNVPSWAAAQPVDHTSGNRWCLSACLKSERTVGSTHSVAETAAAYTTALRAGGWTPAPATACPPAAKGVAQSCWVLDRDQMNVLVTASACAAPPPPATEPGLVDPATPSTRASPSAGCAPTMVSISVFDRIDLRPATKSSQ
jgi:hypothetical protein